MARKFSLLFAVLLVLATLLFLVGCSDDSTDNPIITPSSLTVTAPATGDNWIVGTVHNITWTDDGVDAVDIGYSTNGGASWIGLVQDAPGNSYAWTVPNTPSTTCLIAMRSSADTTVTDLSGAFTISLPVLVGTWFADSAAVYPTLGLDSMRYEFALDSAYTQTQWAGMSFIMEDGDYLAITDSIRFHITSDDSTYTRWYHQQSATALQLDVYGQTIDLVDTLYTVTFRKR